ncbi:hypothetical protein M404DRAFT_825030 [Pisolithus tinctorius Marx 270]|uniref:Uncharacterized protein n=1 Tax=Pisolithus tinctorius Marx 270 TaxID=870435 RepID=A0A0C3NTV8_PISTI|nr:hypothetical protein M404DRAFT_825030 [Pisolithus tinctorius Marx 270]
MMAAYCTPSRRVLLFLSTRSTGSRFNDARTNRCLAPGASRRKVSHDVRYCISTCSYVAPWTSSLFGFQLSSLNGSTMHGQRCYKLFLVHFYYCICYMLRYYMPLDSQHSCNFIHSALAVVSTG